MYFKKGDSVAYRLWNREKQEWYQQKGTVTGYHKKEVIVHFDEDQKEYLCQESRLLKLPTIPTKENSCDRLSE